jgi:hypothetical protein
VTFIRDHLLIIILFLVLIFLLTLPITTNMSDTVLRPNIDTPLNIWIMSWNGHALGTNPTALFQANMNYPSRDSLAFSENLITFSVIAIPVGWITGNPVLTYNLLLLIGFALCGYTMYLLAKYLTANRLAALAAGVFFALVPYHFSTMVHVHVAIYCLQPLLLLFLFRYFDRGGVGNLVGMGLAFLALALLSWYQLAFASIPVALFFIWRLLTRLGRQRWRRLLAIAAAFALCAVIILPFAMPYFRLHRNIPDRENDPSLEIVNDASLNDYWRVLPENWLYARFGSLFYDDLGLKATAAVGAGNALFPGFLFFPLALSALLFSLLTWRKRRRARSASSAALEGEAQGELEPQDVEPPRGEEGRQPEGRSPPAWLLKDTALSGSYLLYFTILGLVAMMLSLGAKPHGVKNYLFEILHKLPFYEFIRFPIRYHILVVMAMSVVVAYACAYIYRFASRQRRNAWGMVAVGVVILLMTVEFVVVGVPSVEMVSGDAIPAVYNDLAGVEDAVVVEAPMPIVYNSVVFEDPITLNWGNPDNYMESVMSEQDAVYYSTRNWKPLVNGLSGYYPVFYRRALVEMQAFPSTHTLEFLATAGVNHIVMHWDRVPDIIKGTVRKQLSEYPGMELVRDYPDGLSLYRMGAVATSGADELVLQVLAPEIVEPGKTFNAALSFINPSQLPFSNTDETRQHLQLRWLDREGIVKEAAEAYFFAPFFVPEGESAVASFSVDAPPKAGTYRLEISADDGMLNGRSWESEINVAALPSDPSGHDKDGELMLRGAQEPQEPVFTLYPAILFNLEMEAVNLGPGQWQRGGPLAMDTVAVSASWSREKDTGYMVNQMGKIPCDVSPGQRLLFPITLQAPYEEGDYILTLRLKVMGVQYLGEPVIVHVHVDMP